MNLIPLRALIEGSRKRRTAYRSGRRELFAGGLDDLLKSAGGRRKKRRAPREKQGRLIKRTAFASKQRWRTW